MMNVESPEQLWNLHGKPLHKTGEVNVKDYLKRLNPSDHLYLMILLYHLRSASLFMHTKIHTLAVGSSADLQSEYGDIDLLVCPEDPQVRSDFIRHVHNRLSSDKRLFVQRQSPKGSAPIFETLYEQFKLFVHPAISVNTQEVFGLFDITFLGERGGSYSDALLFHRQNNLALSRIEGNFPR